MRQLGSGGDTDADQEHVTGNGGSVGQDDLFCCGRAAEGIDADAHVHLDVMLAMQIGEPYVFSEAEQQACRANLSAPHLFKKTWDHYHSKLR